MSVQITLPWPSPTLSPNARVHWSKKAKAVASYRNACAWLARSQGAMPLDVESLSMVVTFHPARAGRIDQDNCIARFKAGSDGLSDALGVDDAKFVQTYVMGQPVKGGAVVVQIGGGE